MDSLEQSVSKEENNEKNVKKSEEIVSTWSEIIKAIIDKLTGKDMELTYNFDNLQIEIPKATGPDGREIGSAKWKIHGKFIISTQLLDKSKTSNKSETME